MALPSPDFAVIQHYSSGLGKYTEEVNASKDNPYGSGRVHLVEGQHPPGIDVVWNVGDGDAKTGWPRHSALHAAFGLGQLHTGRQENAR
jgi:hypothetical protein